MTKVNRQAIFDNFVKALDGKGRAINGGGCVYFPDFDAPDGSGRHPGCAIGCQPGFRERFEGKIKNISIDAPIRGVKTFFKVRNPLDIDFLRRLQMFHDDSNNWNGNFLNQEQLLYFAKRENLKISY